MRRILALCIACILGCTFFQGPTAFAQSGIYLDPNVGNRLYRRDLIMNRNKVESIIGNYGTFGRAGRANGGISGVWPIGTGHGHVDEMTIMVGAEVVGSDNRTYHIMSESYGGGSGRDVSPGGREYWWNPLPGYYNPQRRYYNPVTLRWDTTAHVANLADSTTWPLSWPGKDASWNGNWAGYHGKGSPPDQEAMYVMDDSYNNEFPYFPFAADTNRRGLGLQVETRLFQWAHPLAEDQIFIHFQVSNVCDNDYDRLTRKIYFGAYADTNPGGQGDADDNSGFDRSQNMVYAWDNDNGAASQWTKYLNVLPGYLGWKYLESPGIQGDGIDNDNDGIVDESRDNDAGAWIFGSVGNYGVAKWHWSGDEDGDWVPETDDVGADGAGPNDPGYAGPDADGTEGNGRPDQGEPNFGKVDNDESDQVGLTSFYSPAYGSTLIPGDDESSWNFIQPGIFQTPAQNSNNVWVFASGPFDLPRQRTERFSVCWLFGESLLEIMRNAVTSQRIYDSDYRFTAPPVPPTVHVATGDKKVTLFWDDKAERSHDPIYRGTNPQLSESQKITDAYGSLTYRQPVAQFDLNDGIKGVHPVALGEELGSQYSSGSHYNMGEDTGLRHFYEDRDVLNGVTYYYVVVSYDKGYFDGMDTRGLVPMSPAESPGGFTVENGVLTGISCNAVVATPDAPATNYVEGKAAAAGITHAGGATGGMSVSVVDPNLLPQNHVFEVTFGTSAGADSGIGIPFATSFTVRDTTAGTIVVDKAALSLRPASKDTEAVAPLPWQKYDSTWTSNVFNGMILTFTNDLPTMSAIVSKSGWRPGSQTTSYVTVSNYSTLAPFTYPITFRIEFTDTISGRAFTTKDAIRQIDTYFRVVNVATGEMVPCFLKEPLIQYPPAKIGQWDKGEPLVIGFRTGAGSYVWAWTLDLFVFDAQTIPPKAGDVYNFVSPMPLTTGDRFLFSTSSSELSNVGGARILDKVAVVPNPYVLTALWERETSMPGRGERKISFIHLPSECTIRIYTQNGVLIRTILHAGNIADGSETWDLTTSEGLEVAFGVYVFHIEVNGVGQKVGTFAIIN